MFAHIITLHAHMFPCKAMLMYAKMIQKVILQSFNKITCLSCLIFMSCNDLRSLDRDAPSSIFDFSIDKIVVEHTQDPWHLAAECLSEDKLLNLSGEANTKRITASSPNVTVAVKLRLEGQNPKLPLTQLLQSQAPTYSLEQAQDKLFYHMAEAGYLRFAKSDVHPITAYVEMTTQREQSIDIVFIFSLARLSLKQDRIIRFVLDKAFFLSQPVEFILPSDQLLTSS
jgi:hypothetical protein